MNNLNVSTCIICGSKYEVSKLEGLIECISCRFITTNLNLSKEQLIKLYSEDYFHGQEYGDYLSDKKVFQKNFDNRLKKLLQYTGNSHQKSLFEIGCAYGFFLEVAKSHFNSVSGIDISEDAIKKAKEELDLDVYSDDFLDFELKKHDVYCLWDTIEHLKDPHLFIEKISQNMNKDGVIAITTGDIKSFNAKLRGSNWRQIHPPTHLHYFSKGTLSKLLEINGFEVVYTGHPGVSMSVNNIAYIILVLKYKKPLLYSKLKKMGVLNFNIYWNLFDLLYIIGRKR